MQDELGRLDSEVDDTKTGIGPGNFGNLRATLLTSRPDELRNEHRDLRCGLHVQDRIRRRTSQPCHFHLQWCLGVDHSLRSQLAEPPRNRLGDLLARFVRVKFIVRQTQYQLRSFDLSAMRYSMAPYYVSTFAGCIPGHPWSGKMNCGPTDNDVRHLP